MRTRRKPQYNLNTVVGVAQLVEPRVVIPVVVGSSPRGPTILPDCNREMSDRGLLQPASGSLGTSPDCQAETFAVSVS